MLNGASKLTKRSVSLIASSRRASAPVLSTWMILRPVESRHSSTLAPRFEMNKVYYSLPASRIASTPQPNRGESNLLYYNYGKDTIKDYSTFGESIVSLLDSSCHLIFNESKVLHARLWMTNDGEEEDVEVMLLNPEHPSVDPNTSCISPTHNQVWRAMIRKSVNRGETFTLKVMNDDRNEYGRVLEGIVLHIHSQWDEDNVIGNEVSLKFRCLSHDGEEIDYDSSMQATLNVFGDVPIPPYFDRKTVVEDTNRYQTVYANDTNIGSVAAPTAGLHFTEQILETLYSGNGISSSYIALHVGSGTFKPVVAQCISDHDMHSERFSITLNALTDIAEKCSNNDKKVVCVGTTSVRLVESLYWLGVKALLEGDEHGGTLHLNQWEYIELQQAYGQEELPSVTTAYNALREAFIGPDDILQGSTSLCIVPGYVFRVCTGGLVTNFHQPDSSLMCLVSAFLNPHSGEISSSKSDSFDEKYIDEGNRRIHSIYKHAIEQEQYRFLSYGDACFLDKTVNE